MTDDNGHLWSMIFGLHGKPNASETFHEARKATFIRRADDWQRSLVETGRQISTSLSGSSSRLSAPGGKCSARIAPHRSIAATKPSAGRPSFTADTSA